MPVGDRPYELAGSPDDRAQGPPFLQVAFLITDYAYDLLSALLKSLPSLDRASGDFILLTVAGDSEQSGEVYKRLRTMDRMLSDQEATQGYRRSLRSMEGTDSAEIHLRNQIAVETGRKFGVRSESLPCIVWRTFPNLHPPLITRIKTDWCRDERSRLAFVEAFDWWLGRGRFKRLMDGKQTVGDLRREVLREMKDVVERIDRGTGLAPRKPKASRSAKIRVSLEFSFQEDATLLLSHPALMVVHREGERAPSRVTQLQLFYLTAFILCGESRQAEGRSWHMVDQAELAARLVAWCRARLRSPRGSPPTKPTIRLAREWRRFAEQMNARVGADDWFDSKSWLDRKTGRRYFRQSPGIASFQIHPEVRVWLRETLKRLTGLP